MKTIKDAANKLTGSKRNVFEANVAIAFCEASARKAETVFGWGRRTVKDGLVMLASGVECEKRYSARGRHKTEEELPGLAEAIHQLVEPESQADPQLVTNFAYTRVTALSVRNAVAETTAIAQKDLPSERTIRRILNRLGYRMRRVEKTKPLKKVPETDDIFENIKRVRDESGQDPHCLRISIDTKAKVPLGEFSRRGRSRGKQATRALDHDMKPKQTLVPFGILEVACAQLFVVFGDSRETSDFIVDGLQLWWEERRAFHPAIHKLVIELDNGPSIAS
ncbi:MAG: ISAzo13 family transposase, partial [Chloroflexi bacterium]|nr:ISAzo13 family transposase [Chloroflexota bacterium]